MATGDHITLIYFSRVKSSACQGVRVGVLGYSDPGAQRVIKGPGNPVTLTGCLHDQSWVQMAKRGSSGNTVAKK